MGRPAVKLQLIADKTTRKVTFKKRKASFLKKLKEFKTLCAVDTCAIIQSNYEAKPEFWPCKSEVCRVVDRFKESVKRAENNVDQEMFLKKRLAKVEADLKKEKQRNQRMRVLCLVDKYADESKEMDGTADLAKLGDIKRILDDISQVNHDIDMAISRIQAKSTGDGHYLIDLNKQPALISEDGSRLEELENI